MSVESYLDSIRKNTISNADKTASLNNTIKDLLNYESLKKAVSAGVEKGNREQFKRLAELSKKILLTSDATNAELKETNQLLKLFYAQIPKNSSGNAQVTVDSWVKALKEVLDEFGNSLPQKFQNRLKYDIVSAAAEGGADPKAVFQQLNMTQVNQTVVLQNIYEEMIERQKLIDRKAEAQKPIENQEKRDQANFWETRLGKVITTLSGILDKMTKASQWLGLIYVGLAVWSQLKEGLRNALQGIADLSFAFKGGRILTNLFSKLKIGTEITNALKKSSLFKSFGKIGSTVRSATTNFLWNTKIGNGILDVITNPKINNALKSVGKLFSWVGKIAGPLLRVFNKFNAAILIVSSVYDFIEGFVNTKGTMTDKIIGGLWNVVTKFISSIWDLIKALPGLLWKAVVGLNKVLWKSFFNLLNWIGKSIVSIFNWFGGKGITDILGVVGKAIKNSGKILANGLLKGIAEIIDETISAAPDWLKPGLEWIRSKINVPKTESKIYPAGSFGLELPKGSMFSPATDTVYTGSDALNAAMPLSSHVSGTTPASAAGIRKNADVKLSSQAADFYRRAGLSNRVTSGMEGKHAGTASNPRSHYSGNKFDLDISTTSATAFAKEVGKMLKTPGLVEIRTESVPSSVVEGARRILKAQGYNTSKLINDGYPSYSTGPHLDVLIDPKYSGVPSTSSTKLTTSTKTLDSVADTGDKTPSNPLLADMTKNLTKAFNEQIKLFEKGAKAPNQLASSQSKAATTAITNKLAAKSSGGAVTFNKKNDIQDDSLAALRLLNLA